MKVGRLARGGVCCLLSVAALAYLSSVTASSAHAQEAGAAETDAGATWKRHWRPMAAPDYATTGAAVFGVFALKQWLEPTSPPNVEGGLLFDDGGANLLHADSEAARARARRISDAGRFSLMFVPALLDTALAGLKHDDFRLAGQVLGTYLQAFAYNAFLTQLIKRTSGRERPVLGENCDRRPEASECSSSTTSFPSGHTSAAFTAAGAMLAQHLFVPLYGGGAWEIVGVSLAGGTAALTGTMRLVGARHHSTDVLMGAILGSAVGFTVPYFLRYRSPFGGGERGPHSMQMKLNPLVSGDSTGVGLSVRW